MRFLMRLFYMIGLVLFGLIVLGFFLPSRMVALRHMNLAADPAVIKPLVNDVSAHRLWLPDLAGGDIEITSIDSAADQLLWTDITGSACALNLVSDDFKRLYVVTLECGDDIQTLTLQIDRRGQNSRISLALEEELGGFPWLARTFEPVRRGKRQAYLDHALENLKVIAEGST